MAKNKQTLFPLSGTLGGLTFVQSATYGPHVRRARGTVNPAPVNKTLQQNARRASAITALGAPLLQCFKEMAGTFVQRGLWQVMMKRMFTVGDTSLLALLTSLEGLELNKDHPLEKLVGGLPSVNISFKTGGVSIQISGLSKMKIPRGLKLDSYRYELFVTWIDGKGVRLEGDTQATAWLAMDDEASSFKFNIKREKWVKYMLIVLRVQGGMADVPHSSAAATGMRVMKVFKLPA